MLVPGKLFHPALLFACKARNSTLAYVASSDEEKKFCEFSPRLQWLSWTVTSLSASLRIQTAPSLVSETWWDIKFYGMKLCTCCAPVNVHSIFKSFHNHYRYITAINFILPSNLKFKCEFEFTKYMRGTKYLFIIYQTSQISKLIDQKISN